MRRRPKWKSAWAPYPNEFCETNPLSHLLAISVTPTRPFLNRSRFWRNLACGTSPDARSVFPETDRTETAPGRTSGGPNHLQRQSLVPYGSAGTFATAAQGENGSTAVKREFGEKKLGVSRGDGIFYAKPRSLIVSSERVSG
jgi:hypothetical protein